MIINARLEHSKDRWTLVLGDLPRWLADDLYNDHPNTRISSARFPIDQNNSCKLCIEFSQDKKVVEGEADES